MEQNSIKKAINLDFYQNMNFKNRKNQYNFLEYKIMKLKKTIYHIFKM